jgi:integrase
MLTVSFYLLTPEAKSQSQLYVSISNKINRLRFATGESFITSYCNIRKVKGKKDLVKKNTSFYFDYSTTLSSIRDTLIRIDMELSKDVNKPNLAQIRDIYYTRIGKIKDSNQLTLEEAYDKYSESNKLIWSENTRKKITGSLNHLKEFQKVYGDIKLADINKDTWDSFRDIYCIGKKKFSNNTTNKYLKNFKQFLKYLKKIKIIKNDLNLDELEYLKEIETYNIALKQPEVETLLNLDLKDSLRYDRVRDLFILEILTGQRFSDIPSLLDKNNLHDTYIDIYQKKTNERVKIPLHPELKSHLKLIFKKYPNGLPVISNKNFNDYLKEVCKKAEFNKIHSWITMTGNKKIEHTNVRYNLCTSHVGRRTFCTLALSQGINSQDIMKVSGHKSYEQFKAYIKIDDEDSNIAFGSFTTKKSNK